MQERTLDGVGFKIVTRYGKIQDQYQTEVPVTSLEVSTDYNPQPIVLFMSEAELAAFKADIDAALYQDE